MAPPGSRPRCTQGGAHASPEAAQWRPPALRPRRRHGWGVSEVASPGGPGAARQPRTPSAGEDGVVEGWVKGHPGISLVHGDPAAAQAQTDPEAECQSCAIFKGCCLVTPRHLCGDHPRGPGCRGDHQSQPPPAHIHAPLPGQRLGAGDPVHLGHHPEAAGRTPSTSEDHLSPSRGTSPGCSSSSHSAPLSAASWPPWTVTGPRSSAACCTTQSIMEFRLCVHLALSARLSGFPASFLSMALNSSLRLCSPDVLNHFCDIPPLLWLSCSSTTAIEILDSGSPGDPRGFPADNHGLLHPHPGQVARIPTRPSSLRPSPPMPPTWGSGFSNLIKLVSGVYLVAIPLLKPIIYCLGNGNIRVALVKLLQALPL
nr:uncharacterized protein LOC129048495 [Pongo abelii]